MVRALLDGTKTQTRRVAKEFNDRPGIDRTLKRFPNQRGSRFGDVGDQLWVAAKGVYAALWEAINGPGSWSANPYVWVVEFRKLATTTKREA